MQKQFSVVVPFTAGRPINAGIDDGGAVMTAATCRTTTAQQKTCAAVIGQMWRTLNTLLARALAWLTMHLALLCVDLGEALADISIHLTIYTGGSQC